MLQTGRDIEFYETMQNGGFRGKLNKVVLAYSGGLDTSVIVPWLRYDSCFEFLFPVFWIETFPLFVNLIGNSGIQI